MRGKEILLPIGLSFPLPLPCASRVFSEHNDNPCFFACSFFYSVFPFQTYNLLVSRWTCVRQPWCRIHVSVWFSLCCGELDGARAHHSWSLERVVCVCVSGLQFPFSIPSSDFAVFHLKPKIMKEAGSCPLSFGDLWCSWGDRGPSLSVSFAWDISPWNGRNKPCWTSSTPCARGSNTEYCWIIEWFLYNKYWKPFWFQNFLFTFRKHVFHSMKQFLKTLRGF